MNDLKILYLFYYKETYYTKHIQLLSSWQKISKRWKALFFVLFTACNFTSTIRKIVAYICCKSWKLCK